MKNPTIEQIKVINNDNNCVVTACPGSGKTFTIVEKIKRHSKYLKSYEGIIAISYTNKAADEIKSRLKGEYKKNFFIGTIDVFCLKEIIIPFSKFIVEKNIEDFNVVSNSENKFSYIEQLEIGQINLNDIADISYFILKKVPECLKYLRAKYKMMFVDEYQDCKENQHLIWRFLSKQGIKLVAVGDVDQSIYSDFTDANPEFLKELMSDESFNSFELTVNHRSHQTIVDYAMRFKNANHLTQISEDLRVTKVNIRGNEKNIIECLENNIYDIRNKFNIDEMSNMAIFCRSNDMVSRVCQFLSIPNKNHSLVAFKNEDDFSRFCTQVLFRFFQFKSKEITKKEFVEELVFPYKNQELYKEVRDKVEALCSKDPEDLLFEIDIFCSLYSEIKKRPVSNQNKNELHHILKERTLLNTFKSAEKNEIQVMTYHKSKGLEFNVVFLMDCYRYVMPNEYNNLETEENLHYVGLTRGKEAVYILLGTERFRSRQSDYISASDSIFLSRNGLANLRNYDNWT
ncbi:ATP-dependent helicase [Enterococcus faecalis]|uniref:ATP-dependent helicase n=1 Tax=Enterococcus faecalis TaxID=1351 RepID=UPI002FDC10EF